MGRLAGKIAIVTGGAKGIGGAVSRRFVEEGATVTIADLDDKNGSALAETLGDKTGFAQLDVCDEAAWQSVVEGVIARHGRLDTLVNNAGILKTTNYQSIDDIELQEWRAVLAVNAEGVFLGCRVGVKAMKADGGAIINMSSVAGLIASPPLVAYGASKGAVRQLTKSVAIDCARKGYNIRCNSVHPGYIETELARGSMNLGDGDPVANYRARISVTPMGVAGEPADVANAVLFLASDEARHVTGAELVVDGGLTAV
ncbi:MAG: 3-beta hydroxysteroid dehydrogenase [Rhodospirillaceae bacterium]|nr:3-beta hydroxysteroid dehydrogenase [Rhodospirillaceae bacterium]